MDAIWAWVQRALLSDEVWLTLLIVPVLAVLEHVRPAVKSPIKHYLFGFRYWLVNMVLLALVLPVATTLVARVLQSLGFGLIDLTYLGFPGVGGALLALLISTLVADFFFYWFHRTLHANRWLWQAHLLHHSDEHMNAMTAHRGHVAEMLISPLFIAIPAAILFDLPPVTIGFLSLIPQAYLFFAHANIRLHFGPLWWLIISPDFHRIHHSIEDRHRDKNFTNWFPVWDILFGTAYIPEPDEHPETGVDGVHVKTVRQALLLPFAGWWAMSRGRRPNPSRPAD